MQIISNATKNQNRILIIIFGPPGSGKTTLASTLYHLISKNTQQLNRQVMIISGDTFEQYLRDHSASQLQQQLAQQSSYDVFLKNRIKRKVFDDAIWKRSRQFIKQNVQKWLDSKRIVIVQDDMLLKSQRKYFRHIAEQTKIKYLEIMIQTTYEECLESITQRQMTSGDSQESLSVEVLKNSFQKFQIQKNQYLFIVRKGHQIQWQQIEVRLKYVEISHPELAVKQASEDKPVMAQEVRIRKFISEIIRSEQLQLKYCQNQEIQTIAAYLSLMKKKFNSKNKTLQGFIQFMTTETIKGQKK